MNTYYPYQNPFQTSTAYPQQGEYAQQRKPDCIYHKKESAGKCSKCGKPLCEDCLRYTTMCHNCLLEHREARVDAFCGTLLLSVLIVIVCLCSSEYNDTMSVVMFSCLPFSLFYYTNRKNKKSRDISRLVDLFFMFLRFCVIMLVGPVCALIFLITGTRNIVGSSKVLSYQRTKIPELYDYAHEKARMKTTIFYLCATIVGSAGGALIAVSNGATVIPIIASALIGGSVIEFIVRVFRYLTNEDIREEFYRGSDTVFGEFTNVDKFGVFIGFVFGSLLSSTWLTIKSIFGGIISIIILCRRIKRLESGQLRAVDTTSAITSLTDSSTPGSYTAWSYGSNVNGVESMAYSMENAPYAVRQGSGQSLSGGSEKSTERRKLPMLVRVLIVFLAVTAIPAYYILGIDAFVSDIISRFNVDSKDVSGYDAADVCGMYLEEYGEPVLHRDEDGMEHIEGLCLVLCEDMNCDSRKDLLIAYSYEDRYFYDVWLGGADGIEKVRDGIPANTTLEGSAGLVTAVEDNGGFAMLDAAYDNDFISVTGFDGNKPDTYLQVQSDSFSDGISECSYFIFGNPVSAAEYDSYIDNFLNGRQISVYALRNGMDGYYFGSTSAMIPEDVCRKTVETLGEADIFVEYTIENEPLSSPKDDTENMSESEVPIEDILNVSYDEDGCLYFYEVPQLSYHSDDAIEINSEIRKKYLTTAEQQQELLADGESPIFGQIGYNAVTHNNTLSLLMYCYDTADGSSFDAYCLDLNTGTRLTTQEVVALAGYSFDEYTELYQAAIDKCFYDIWGESFTDGNEFTASQYEQTLEWNNPYECDVHISEDGELCIVALMATAGGSGEYYYCISVAPVR